MGLEDRQYYRSEYDARGGFGSPGSQSMVNTLLMINIGVWVLNTFTGEAYHDYFTLHSDLWAEPWRIYGLVTYGFTHAKWGNGNGVWHIVINMFVLWMFGREVEGRLGRWEFLRFYMTAVLISGVTWLAYTNLVIRPDPTRPVSLVGASGAVMGVFAMFVFYDPKRTLLIWGVIPAPAWLLFGLYVLSDVIGMRSGSHVAHEAHLAGVGFAAAYHYLGWNLSRFAPGNFSLKLPRLRRPNLKVHRPETGDDVESSYRQLEEEGDRILQKIQTQGESSLTSAERKTLERYSRRMRQKHR